MVMRVEGGGTSPRPTPPGPRTTPPPTGVVISGVPGSTTTGPSSSTETGPTSYRDWREGKTRNDNTLPIAYRPPTTPWYSADRQEREIQSLPAIYKAQTIGDALNLYWSDPASKQIIVNAARVYYKDYPNFNDQWAEGFWGDIVNQANHYGAAAPWVTLQQVLSGQVTPAGQGPSTSSSSSSYSGGGGYGGGGGGQVSLTNPTSARGLLLQTMQNVLGRNPTDNEYKTFLQVLNEAEMANPQTVSVEGDTVVGSGGTDPGVLALEFAQDQEDYKERQGDMYFETFMRALAGGA